jgi:hypothetical protein
MNPYLIEPYTIFQGKKKDKHWMEIADEEALYFKMIQDDSRTETSTRLATTTTECGYWR